MTEPNNHSTKQNPVGRFMVAVGAVIKLTGTDKILIIRRASSQDWQPGEWEIPYGRIDQHEDLETALRRELKEETGLNQIKIGSILRNWHIYRGKRAAFNEVIGLTFECETSQKEIKLSHEHSDYQWVNVEKAMKIVTEPGIKRDVEKYLKRLQN